MNDSEEELRGVDLLIEGDKIGLISKALKPEKAERVIDATGMVVVPGFVNTHHHFYQTLTRNIPAVQDAPLFEWLLKSYEIWRQLTLEGVELSTRTAILEMMKSGVTTSSDHLYLFPEKTGKALIDAEIQVATQMGLRFHATRGSMSLGKSLGGLPPDDVVQTETQIEEDMERLFREYHDDSEGSMTRLALAPCSPFSVTPELMRRTLKFAKDHGLLIHTHLAETLDEEKFCIKRFGMRPVEYMESLGWLDPLSWFAHCVHLLPEEIKNMGETRCGVSHCPSSNMRLGSGIAPIREMLNEGVRVSLGVDGSASNDSSNMLLEMRNAMLLSRLRDQEQWLTAREVLRLATRGGAEVLGREDIGQIVSGKQADLALFRIDGVDYAGAQADPLAALVFCTRMQPVDYLIIKGKIRIDQGKPEFDEQAHVSRHNQYSLEMLERAGSS
jgi:cytosine/adenosine deaminase-related metal-dependent hydrolase